MQTDSRQIDPSRILYEGPFLSLTTTQGLVLWSGIKAQWRLRCDSKYLCRQLALDGFMAEWLGVLEGWWLEHNMCCDRVDLQHIIG